MELTTESGMVVVLERSSRDLTANVNGPDGTVAPMAYGGPVMGAWGTNSPAPGVPPVVPWQGWPVEWSTPTWNGAGLGSRIGVAMSACDLNSRQMASFPVYCMRGGEVIPSPNWVTNPEPSLYADWSEAVKQLVNSLQLRGETFLWCTGRYADDSVARWAVVNPDVMGVQAVDGAIEYRMNTELLDPRDVLHIRHQSWPGRLRGIGPLEWVANNVMSAAALEAHVTNLALRGGVPWAVLKSKRVLDGKQSTDLQSAWVQASANRNGAPAVLSGDLEFEVVQLSPSDIGLLDLRIFDEQAIASAFGVPPFLLGLPQPGGMTYSNASSLFDYHWRATLRPMAQSIANALGAWATPLGQRIEFNPDRYVQPPFTERATGYQAMFNIVDAQTGERAMTIEEIRAAERFLPVPAAAGAVIS